MSIIEGFEAAESVPAAPAARWSVQERPRAELSRLWRQLRRAPEATARLQAAGAAPWGTWPTPSVHISRAKKKSPKGGPTAAASTNYHTGYAIGPMSQARRRAALPRTEMAPYRPRRGANNNAHAKQQNQTSLAQLNGTAGAAGALRAAARRAVRRRRRRRGPFSFRRTQRRRAARRRGR